MVIQPPKVGVVILNYNGAEEVLHCLEALRESRTGNRRVWVVDNDSTDGSKEALPPALFGEETWLETGANLGYAGGNNAGIREALAWGAEYILILNPDCEVEAGFLPPLLRALEAVPRAGIACPLILEEDGVTVQSLGGEASLWTGRCRRRLHGRPADGPGLPRWSEVDFPHGACMLLKRSFLEEAGLLNEAYFLYYEDVELGLRARREVWKTLAIPNSRVRHRDTTKRGIASPVVTYFGTRNQAWVVAEYGRLWHHMSFLFLSCCLRWPLKTASRLLRGRFRASWAVVRGAWDGVWSKAWRDSRHTALPRAGRLRRMPNVV